MNNAIKKQVDKRKKKSLLPVYKCKASKLNPAFLLEFRKSLLLQTVIRRNNKKNAGKVSHGVTAFEIGASFAQLLHMRGKPIIMNVADLNAGFNWANQYFKNKAN